MTKLDDPISVYRVLRPINAKGRELNRSGRNVAVGNFVPA